MAPAVDHFIDDEGRKSFWTLRNHNASAAFIEFLIEPVAVERLVGEKIVKVDPIDKRRHANGVKSVAWQKDEAHEIAERIGQCEDFGRPAALGFTNGLILSPPFAPWPCR